jgi:hypothetical protein
MSLGLGTKPASTNPRGPRRAPAHGAPDMQQHVLGMQQVHWQQQQQQVSHARAAAATATAAPTRQNERGGRAVDQWSHRAPNALFLITRRRVRNIPTFSFARSDQRRREYNGTSLLKKSRCEAFFPVAGAKEIRAL